MTDAQKHLVSDLLLGRFLVKTINSNGQRAYKLYEGNMNPVRYVRLRTVDTYPVWEIIKKDKKGKITLNRTKVRQLHGKSWIKQQYKKLIRKL